MAYSSAAISASDLALRAADKPLLVGRNWLRDVAADPIWNTGGTWATADATATGYDTSYLFDDYSHLVSKPGSDEDTWYLLIDLGAAAPGVVDFVGILSPSADISGVQIDVQIADDNGYSSNLVTAATKTPTSDTARVVFDKLYHTGTTPLRYSSVRWMRLVFTGSAVAPTFGELIIGRSRQLKHAPMLPYEITNYSSLHENSESMSGIITRYTHHKNRKRLKADIWTYADAFTNDFESFWFDDIDGGALPFLWVEKPTTTPTGAYWMMMENPDLIGTLDDWVKRNYIISAIEQGPHFLKNEV